MNSVHFFFFHHNRTFVHSLSDGDTFFRFFGVFFDDKTSSSSLLSSLDAGSLYETRPAKRFRDLPPGKQQQLLLDYHLQNERN
jgi:hypothetical protein